MLATDMNTKNLFQLLLSTDCLWPICSQCSRGVISIWYERIQERWTWLAILRRASKCTDKSYDNDDDVIIDNDVNDDDNLCLVFIVHQNDLIFLMKAPIAKEQNQLPKNNPEIRHILS